MKKIIAIAALAAVGATCYGITTTQSLYYGSAGLAVEKDGEVVEYEINGIGVRGVTCPADTGFYYGADLYSAFPWVGINVNGESDEFLADEDLYLSFKAPLGYRWPAKNSRIGLYVGGGPSVQLLTDIENSVLVTFGGFGEVGLQTNKTDGLGFHLGLQLGYCPVMYRGGDTVDWDDESVHAMLQIGVSWRRTAENR